MFALGQCHYHQTQASSTPSTSFRGQASALTTTFQYAYDAVGNRTAQTATITSTQVTNYAYDAANRLTNRTESTGQTYTYAWSDSGQMLAEYYQGTPIRTFTYNAAGQLSEATVLTLTTRFRYDGDGQRLSLEVVGQNTTTYALDYLKSNRILMETTAQTTTLYLYGQSCLGEWTAASGWKYYLQSTLGQVRQAVDSVGNVIYSWAYNPDGTMLQGVQGPITHLECGAVYDWSTGLIYRLGRYFDPTTGVWLVGTGMVLAQAGSGRKRKRRTRLLLLFILLLCLGAILVGCGGNAGPSLDPSPCKEIIPVGGDLGNNAVFIGPSAGNSLDEYPPALTWDANDKQTVGDELNNVMKNFYGGSGSPNANPPVGAGFGSLPKALVEMGITPDSPIRLVRRHADTIPNAPVSPAAAWRPWVYVHDNFFDPATGHDWQVRSLVHEIAHYWDDTRLNSPNMAVDAVNWGDTPTDYGSNPYSRREVFAEAVTVYFLPQYDVGRKWTDDLGAGLNMANDANYGGRGRDGLRLDSNQLHLPVSQRMLSKDGTEQVYDRYDAVENLFTGKWK